MATSADPVERSWDLSLYELHRTPQEALTDDNLEIAVSARSLQSELTCPICLDMLTQTMTTKECLHRFCAECIVTALRSGNKECPTCRKKLVSKRSLRPDPNFDQLVEKIFPNREEYEAHQESILESLSRSHSQNFITSITDGIKAQMAHAKAATKKKNNYDDHPDSPHHTPITGSRDDEDDEPVAPPPKKKKKIKPAASLQASVDDGSESGPSGSGTQEIEIVFKLHPSMKERHKELVDMLKDGSTRFIKTTAKALVEHLCKYLAMRISLDLPSLKKDPDEGQASLASTSAGLGGGDSKASVNNVTIFIAPTPGNIVELEGTTSLAQVNERHWKVNKPMEMYYSFDKA